MKKIAVIGAGYFGCLNALVISNIDDIKIDLYEKKSDILLGASGKNQMRAHVGYHYPRSPQTVKEIKKNTKDFEIFFPKGIFRKTKNYYCIAREETKTDSRKYLEFLKQNNFYFKLLKNFKYANDKNIESSFLVKEKIIDIFKVRNFLKKKIQKNKKISLLLNTKFSKKKICDYDKIIYNTYHENNENLHHLPEKLQKKKYELIEKIVVKMPETFKNTSIVVIDGNFVCIDPYLGTKYHLLSDVKLSKIEISKGIIPKFKSLKKKYIHKNLIKNKKLSNFLKFVKNSSKYLPLIKEAKYFGSFYSVRTINEDKNDRRTTEIKKIGKKIYTVYSGKWISCVSTSKKLNILIKKDFAKVK
jgi:hypothetical protein